MNYQGNNPEGYPDPTANQAVGISYPEKKRKLRKQRSGQPGSMTSEQP